MEFLPFPKIGRLRRNIVVTEKIDGTNAAVRIVPLGIANPEGTPYTAIVDDWVVYAQSRSQFITPGKMTDNYGFAAWVEENAPDLINLGEGSHFGEWWGAGIQRKYGQDRKRFSLFNATRWATERPACCDVVPVLYGGIWEQAAIENCIATLRESGSVAAPGFMRPEGVIVYHPPTKTLFKQTLEKDEEPKGLTPA